MDRKRYIILCIISFSFLMLFSIGGCSTAQKKTALPETIKEKKPEKIESRRKLPVPNKITHDVLYFKDLQEVDLFKDGKKVIIAICALNTAPSGVKVIKVDNIGDGILFEKSFRTPNTKFVLTKGIPTIKFEDIDPSTGRKIKRNYCWNGKDFVLR